MPTKQYDYLIVGSGLFGAVFAAEMKKAGKKCFVIDKRQHAGGNVYCKRVDDINIHVYGAHIFHTDDERIWKYVNSLVEFNGFRNSPLIRHGDKIYNLPFNMNTFYQLWNVTTPAAARDMIESQTKKYKDRKPSNLEEQALSLVGDDIYHTMVKEYTEKQWGRKATDLPAFIIKRIPLRFTYDNNYFSDRYQGIPKGGYNVLINALLRDTEVRLEVDYHKHRKELDELADKIVYTGKIDEFFGFSLGRLEYRSLRFEHTRLNLPDFQGNAVVNYPESHIPYTRIIEHKHFEYGSQPLTIITKEFPSGEGTTGEPFYPVNDERNNRLYHLYKDMAMGYPDVIFGGRLGEFRYYDMHQVIGSALSKVRKALISN